MQGSPTFSSKRAARPPSRTADNTEQVKQLVRADRRLTVRMIASELSISKETVWKIITEDLGMRKICAKMVPKLLSDDQKERRVLVCKNILECLETEPNLLGKVITGVITHESLQPKINFIKII